VSANYFFLFNENDPAISESQKQLPNCLKITDTSMVIIVFNGVVCDVSAYTVTVYLCRWTWIRY